MADNSRDIRTDLFDLAPCSATIGAEISGIDLRAPTSPELKDALYQALLDWKVLFFRDQDITTEQHMAFARCFGELEIHPFAPKKDGAPEILPITHGPDNPGKENTWHSDVTWRKEPSLGSILRMIDGPGHGGDTLFADMYAAFEGLPKDVRALTYKARELDLEVPMLGSVMASNAWQVQRGVDHVMRHGHRKVGVLGFSFKANTDDLRESPIVEVIERLLGKGHDIRIYDSNVNMAKLMGANRDYIMKTIPHISAMMSDSIDDVLDHADTIVIGNGAPEFSEIPDRLKDGQVLVDLVRVIDQQSIEGRYDGICW